jgi:hypothetical protein
MSCARSPFPCAEEHGTRRKRKHDDVLGRSSFELLNGARIIGAIIFHADGTKCGDLARDRPKVCMARDLCNYRTLMEEEQFFSWRACHYIIVVC